MFRTMSEDSGLSSAAGRGASSPGLAAQESPWLGLLSAVSRPALALLQRPLPARPRSAPPPGERSQADWKNRQSDAERDVFRLLNDALAAPQRCYLRCEPREAVLQDQDLGALEGHARTLLSQVWWSCEDPPQGSKTLWTSFLGGVARTDWAWTWDRPGPGPTQRLQLYQNLKQRHPLAETEGSGGLLLAPPSQSSATWWRVREVGELQQAPPTPPDQDHGYSSLEEEFVHTRGLYLAERPLQEEEEGAEPVEVEQVECVALPPQCQNKSIAFIMGCPCSDDEDDEDDDESSSQSEGQSSDDDDDDDDGFDSEGSSDLSTSSGEDDPEAELLWASLCRSQDPYDPRNFTAHLHTGPAPPRAPSPPSSPLPPPPSPPPDSWDESTSASEAEEADGLWASFSCSSDPYSPLNFQAPLRTRSGPPAASPRRGPAPTTRPDSSPSQTPRPSPGTKKVRFSEQVDFFFASGDEEEGLEDRRGPWEQLARDRCRFLRRCQQVELSVGPCLQPQHRSMVYLRLAAWPQP
ncbi:protein phosphatase 1 regulatory subunit 15B-like [Nelusetta ayraudi]|uniref:protein phosphatase 1 regulatory subunit 15B-like n=1 Tax=Nelusetta ayraudi TaxID=303726 RepID=UPI003F6F8EEE